MSNYAELGTDVSISAGGNRRVMILHSAKQTARVVRGRMPDFKSLPMNHGRNGESGFRLLVIEKVFSANTSPALGQFGIYNEPRTYGLEARVRF